MRALQKQMESLRQRIEDSKNQVSDVKKEMRELKKAQSTSFRKAFTNVTPGSVSVPEKADKSTFGIIIRGIPYEQVKPIDRMNTELAKVDANLSFLDIEDRKLTKTVRLVKNCKVRKKNRPLFVRTASDISKNLILKSAHKLKHFSTDDHPVFVSPELNSEDTKKHDEYLKTRGEILDDLNNSLTAKNLRIRNMSLVVLQNSTWSILDKTRCSKSTQSSKTDEQGQKRLSTLSFLTFNVRSLLDLKRRMQFSNCPTSISPKVFRITETWLTSEFPNSALFLPSNHISGSDRPIDVSHMTKQGCLLIAFHFSVCHEILETDIKNPDHCVLKLLSSTQSILVCYIYNAPAQSICQWEQIAFFRLLQKLHSLAETHFCDSIVITGDLNFYNTNWDNMSSENVYESNCLGKLIELNLSNFSSSQLDVLLCKNPNT